MIDIMRLRLLHAPICAAILLSSCTSRQEPKAPERATDSIEIPNETSQITVPIDTSLTDLAVSLDRVLPRTLWTIEKRESQCVPPQRLKILGARLKVTPAIACSLSGEVSRGNISLSGEGRTLIVEIPVNARVTARDVAGKLKGETANGSAHVQARIALDVNPDWRPRGSVKLHYDWTTPPGIDFLGHRITFTDKADAKLAPLVQQLEHSLPKELAKLDLRGKAELGWRAAFTSISLNDENPPVWMRVTPRRISLSPYEISNGTLHLTASVDALTETFIGQRPDDPSPTPLPNLTHAVAPTGLRFFIPVAADYQQLQPILMKALVKRSQRPFDLPGVGPVTAQFRRVRVYGTGSRHIAVGIDLAATPSGNKNGATTGRIWLTAQPVNAPGSAKIAFADLGVSGTTNGRGSDLLIALGNSPGISALIGAALEQDLGHDLTGLIAKVRSAIAYRRQGDFIIRAKIDTIQSGVVQAAGDGVHLPVRAIGRAQITYAPQRSRTR